MKRSPRRKGFKGLIPYGAARIASLQEYRKNLNSLRNHGAYSALEVMESHVIAQRRFRKKIAA